ncbi:MAG: 2,5-diamino-6-(ribosylamino)-4(3H)-pyrimidinone 5'-phosphate reductase [Candidatus Nitrosocaldaceae archaeon]
MENYKPYTILNAAMSLDGKIASKSRDSKISSEKDLLRVHKLRSEVDAIMIGINTAINDDPLLTARYGYNAKPIRVIVDSNVRIRKDSRIVKSSKEIKTILAIAENNIDKARELEEHGIEVIAIGEHKVDLKRLLSILYSKNIKSLMLEGGGELNWSMLYNGLVDEIIISIAPLIIGGRDAITLVEGDGFTSINSCIRLHLKDVIRIDDEVIVRYNVINNINQKSFY